MKSPLLRFWRWLGRILRHDTKYEIRDTAPSDELRTTSDESGTVAPPPFPAAAPPVTLPPPLPPQMDIHAGEVARFGRKASILTRNEEKLYRSLLLALRSEYQIMAKVRLWDILWLTNEPPERKQHNSRLSCRHVDFLLCEPLTLKPLLAIELDDRSHTASTYAQESDRYKDEIFASANLPLLRLPHSNFPSRQLRRKIEEQLGIGD